jgi:hypothetical protein
MKYKRKEEIIEATQWFENGDHPNDNPKMYTVLDEVIKGEGQIVRFFYTSEDSSVHHICPACGKLLQWHGHIENEFGGYVVCPGDFIITDPRGFYYPMNAKVFKRLYEEIV